MERPIIGKRPSFRPAREGTNFFRVLLYLTLILAGVWFLVGYQRGEVRSPFAPTPTPTRSASSYIAEAEAHIESGKLYDPDPPAPTPARPDAIDAFKKALEMDPTNAEAAAELARVQVYSSTLLRNDKESLARLEEAVVSARKAVELNPDSSEYHATLAFALDWLAGNTLVDADREKDLLSEAELAAKRAIQLDPENALALAYYAEVLVDQQKWLQARQYAEQAVAKNPNAMDTHRVLGYALESLGYYSAAIEQYQQAVELEPNMTFLYVYIGALYREGLQRPDDALDYFDRAAKINEQLGVENPIPYIQIARTYTQQGEFFIAARNAEKALQMDRFNANTYGQLGMIYRRARNYEAALILLKCAVLGCTAEENEMGEVAVEGLDLTNTVVAYYYVDYGTNLAFLSRNKPGENFCTETTPQNPKTALEILDLVRQVYPDDASLIGIIEDSEGICRNLQQGRSVESEASPSTPEVMATPEAGEAP